MSKYLMLGIKKKEKIEKEIRTKAHNVENKKRQLDIKPFLVSTY